MNRQQPSFSTRLRGFILAAILSTMVATATGWALLILGRTIAGPALIDQVWQEQLMAMTTPVVSGLPALLTPEEADRLRRRRDHLPTAEPGLRARILEQALMTTSTLGAAARVHGILPFALVGSVLTITGVALWLRTGPIARIRSGSSMPPPRRYPGRRQREREDASAILDGLQTTSRRR